MARVSAWKRAGLSPLSSSVATVPEGGGGRGGGERGARAGGGGVGAGGGGGAIAGRARGVGGLGAREDAVHVPPLHVEGHGPHGQGGAQAQSEHHQEGCAPPPFLMAATTHEFPAQRPGPSLSSLIRVGKSNSLACCLTVDTGGGFPGPGDGGVGLEGHG